jgi:hypothetical protein
MFPLALQVEETVAWEPLWSRNWKRRSPAELALASEVARLLGEPRLAARLDAAAEEVGIMLIMFDLVGGNVSAWSGRFPEVEAAADGMLEATQGWEPGTYLPGLARNLRDVIQHSTPETILAEWPRWAVSVRHLRSGGAEPTERHANKRHWERSPAAQQGEDSSGTLIGAHVL